MYRMTILYGKPTDAEAFDAYYRDVHIPLASKMEGLTAWRLHWVDDSGEESGAYHLVADLYAESAEAMDAILDSPAGRAARADLDNFVTGGVEFLTGEEETVI